VADSGTHSGFKGSSAHLAGEPVVLMASVAVSGVQPALASGSR